MIFERRSRLPHAVSSFDLGGRGGVFDAPVLRNIN
jgi:hypothetical protein